MDTLPPQQIPPASAPAIPSLPPKSSGCGCFGAGCLTLLIVAFLGLAALVGGGWYIVSRAIDNYTATSPVSIATAEPSEAELAAVSSKLEQFRDAIHERKASTFTFTADELNALVARHPDFVRYRGKLHLAIADSLATVEMSAPLDSIGWSRLKHRYFTGSTNFSFIYADEGFRFDANWVEANGHRFQRNALTYAQDSFSRSFTRSFKKGVNDQGASEFWSNVKTMTLDEGKLVIITRGGN